MAAREVARDIPSIPEILSKRSAWFTALGLFCGNYFWYFLITWLPAYLEKERHFPKTKMAIFGWLPFVSIALSCIVAADGGSVSSERPTARPGGGWPIDRGDTSPTLTKNPR